MNEKPTSRAQDAGDATPTGERATFLVDTFPVERVAHITASMHVEPQLEADILGANGLSAPEWKWIERHTREVIAEETRVGGGTRQSAFDRAYLAYLTEERGEVTLEEYARLVVAQERGTRREVHVELSIPELATLPISRNWQQRAAADGAVARALRTAVEHARGAKQR